MNRYAEFIYEPTLILWADKDDYLNYKSELSIRANSEENIIGLRHCLNKSILLEDNPIRGKVAYVYYFSEDIQASRQIGGMRFLNLRCISERTLSSAIHLALTRIRPLMEAQKRYFYYNPETLEVIQ